MEERKTIGILVGGVMDDFTKVLCKGLRNAAEEYNVNLIVLPGKFIDRDYADNLEIMYEYQYSTVFSCATKENLDGIIVAANCIGCFATKERLKDFMHQFDGIPCVLVSSQIDGYVSVNFDNYKGIRDGLEYLIRELHCTRIGMIGGPEDISDSIARKNTFERTLRENGIPVDPKRFTVSEFGGKSYDVYAKFLDDNPDIEAVFCANDEIAAGLYEEMKKRNLMPGQDISVFGYDDVDWCSQIFPTLSSVRADAALLGLEALQLLLRAIAGDPVESVELPTQFLRRNSVCRPAGMNEDQDELREQYLTMSHWLDEQRDKQNRANFEMKHFIMKILRFEKGSDQSYGEVLGTMDWLGIYNAFLYTFENPMIHLNHEPFHMPEEIYMKAAQRDGVVTSVPSVRQKISTARLYDTKALGIKKPLMLVMLPLYSNEMLYGLLMCDMTNGIMENGEFLGNLMSAAVKMINLLKTNETIMMQLEESLNVLQENNLKLDTLTKRDPLTGIWNRRGFFQQAEPLMKSCKEKRRPFVVIYVDMNNLKIINDRYGHDDGDFSLRTIADILNSIVGEEGIAARIGGDEYACAIASEENPKQILERIYDRFTVFNDESDKPYNVTVSAGAYRFSENDRHSLEDGLTLADEQLYEVKKHRKKDVAKTNV